MAGTAHNIFQKALVLCAIGVLCAGCGDNFNRQLAMANRDFEHENYAQAEAGYERILEEHTFDGEEQWLVFFHNRIGQALVHQEKLEEAVSAFLEADRVVAATPDLNCESATKPSLHLTPLYVRLGRLNQAVLVAERAVTLIERCEPVEELTVLLTLGNLGSALQAQDRSEEALALSGNEGWDGDETSKCS